MNNEQGGRTIRYMRVRKYGKRYRKIILGVQILLLWYILILSGVQLNSYTNAAFNDTETLAFTLKTQWDIEDENTDNGWASLEFISIKADFNEIAAVLKNGDDSKAMPVESNYEIWWAETGNALNLNEGELVAGGTFQLVTGEQITLKYSPTKTGTYRFIAFQEEGKPGKETTQVDIEVEIEEVDELNLNEASVEKAEEVTKEDESATKVDEPIIEADEEVVKEDEVVIEEIAEVVKENEIVIEEIDSSTVDNENAINEVDDVTDTDEMIIKDESATEEVEKSIQEN